MKIIFKIAAALLLVGAVAQNTSAMTPIPDKDINGYIIRSNGAEANKIPTELNTFLLGKVFTGAPQELAACKMKLHRMYPIDADHTLLVVDVMDAADAPVQTYALTMYSPGPKKWEFIDGSLVKQDNDINIFVNEIKFMEHFDDVLPDHHELHADPTAVNVTRSFDIKIFLADVGMQTYSNDVTLNYLVDPKTKNLCMADTNSAGAIHNPGGPAMMYGAPPIPASTTSVGATVPPLALELLQVLCSPLSDNTRLARWTKLAGNLSRITCNDEFMIETTAALIYQNPQKFVKDIDLADEGVANFVTKAIQTNPSLKPILTKALKGIAKGKAKAWKKIIP